MSEMFCFQCQQTAGGTGCVRTGVCGKQPETANLQDELIYELMRLALASEKSGRRTKEADRLLMDGLFTTLTNVNFDSAAIRRFTERVIAQRKELGGWDGTLVELWKGDTDTVSLRSTLLFGLKGMAAYAHHSLNLGREDPEVTAWFYKGLCELNRPHTVEQWLALIMEFGQVNFQCMALLDSANTSAFGDPVPTRVNADIKKGPFIVVSGHDLEDLHQLLEQTAGKGINVYTHCEMLPAHGYPALKKYPHLAGNFGTAWQSQQKEFEDIPAPVLFTTNCLMPPRPSYADRVYTTSVVGYEGLRHISGNKQNRKDFTPLIQQSLALGGYEHDRSMSGINGGHKLTTGFAHSAVLAQAPQLIEAIQSGAVKHIFLVGGCDGAHPGRNYYTEFVKQTPMDSLVLTLACQRLGLGRNRRPAPHSGHGSVQRCLQCHPRGAGAGGSLRLHRERPAPDAGAVVVRAEGRVYPADAAEPRHQEHVPRPHPAGLPVGDRGEDAGGRLRPPAHHRAGAGHGRHPAPRLTRRPPAAASLHAAGTAASVRPY